MPTRPSVRPRLIAALVTSTVLAAGAALVAGAGSSAAEPVAAASGSTEAHVTGDAWVRFSIEPGNPLRRFIVDAHGGPFRVVDGKIVMGDARGTIRMNHPSPDANGVMRDNWGTVAVDYVMTGGPVAVVSGTSTGNAGWPKGTRMSVTVYDDPRGRRFDRIGFSWGVVDGRCHRMGLAPAPFTSYASGPGYHVRSAELPAIPEDTEGPDDPPAC
jgi:hypothetical protein